MKRMNLVLVGAGQVGLMTARAARDKANFDIIGAVDADPAIQGKDLGELCGGAPSGIKVEASVRGLLNRVAADAAIVTTVSSLEAAAETLKEIISCAVPAVTTCEELAYPWRTAPRLAAELDVAARRRGVAVVGAGVNPGFLMDFLPLIMSSICQQVDCIRIARVQNTAYRRPQFQYKVGVGMTPREFAVKNAAGGFGHIGLPESMHMLADAFGWELDHFEDKVEPVIGADGVVAGIRQEAAGYVAGARKIELFFQAADGECDPHDRIEITGNPSFVSRIEGGINGDIASAAIVLNCAAALKRSSAGLHTMADFPVPYWNIR